MKTNLPSLSQTHPVSTPDHSAHHCDEEVSKTILNNIINDYNPYVNMSPHLNNVEIKTDIEKIGDNSYKLLHKFDEQVIEFIVEHNRDKVNFIFEMVYPTDKSALGNLFPEEIQLAMFDKLAKNVPQVLDDLKIKYPTSQFLISINKEHFIVLIKIFKNVFL